MYHFKIMTELAQLTELSRAWNDLWTRCGSRVVNLRSEVVELIASHFFDPREFRALVVFRDQQLVAALPLRVRNRVLLGQTGQSLGNPHAPMAGLLLDNLSINAEFEKAFRAGLRAMGLSFLQLDWFHLDDPGSRWLLPFAQAQGWAGWVRRPEQVVMLEVPKTQETLQQTSPNHRKKLRRWLRDLSELGSVTLEEVTHDHPERIADCLDEALQVELQSWKGPAGSAIRSNAHELAYWRTWQATLNAVGLLRLYLLRLKGVPIAFDLGYVAQRVYSSVKISHVESLAKHGVGHVRDWLLLERLRAEQQIDWIDTIAPGTDAKWSGRKYPIGKIVMSTGGWVGNAQVNLLETLQRYRTAGEAT